MDYSPFYCKNFYKDRRKKQGKPDAKSTKAAPMPIYTQTDNPTYTQASDPTQKQASDTNIHTPTPTANKDFAAAKPTASLICLPKRKRRKGFFVVVLILLCFAIVVVGADLFGGGFVLDELKNTFGTSYMGKHYLVAKSGFATKQKAEIDALSVREGGAAGYVYNTNKGYYVVLSAYKDKKSAESVKHKNNGLEIVEVTMKEPPKDNLTAKQTKLCDKVLKLIAVDIDTLYELIEQVSQNKKSVDDAAAKLLDMRNSLLEAKAELLDASLPNDIRNAYLNVIDPMFGGLDAIVYKEPDEYFIASMRFVLIQSIVAFVG